MCQCTLNLPKYGEKRAPRIYKYQFCSFRNQDFGASGKLKKILKREIVQDEKVIQSTFFIGHTNYIVYFWLSVKTIMQPALDALKIPILPGVKKAGREKFRKHQNPKSVKKSVTYVLLVDNFFAVVRSQQNPMYECNFESYLILKGFYSANFSEVAKKLALLHCILMNFTAISCNVQGKFLHHFRNICTIKSFPMKKF